MTSITASIECIDRKIYRYLLLVYNIINVCSPELWLSSRLYFSREHRKGKGEGIVVFYSKVYCRLNWANSHIVIDQKQERHKPRKLTEKHFSIECWNALKKSKIFFTIFSDKILKMFLSVHWIHLTIIGDWRQLCGEPFALNIRVCQWYCIPLSLRYLKCMSTGFMCGVVFVSMTVLL